MKRRWRTGAGLVTLALVATRAGGSGGPPPTPSYVTSVPRDDADRAALASGRIGIVKGDATDALLYLDWRALNRLAIGSVAADALTIPCCGTPGHASWRWLDARRQVPDVRQDIYYISTEREGPNYTTIPNCFDDAFVTAAATLDDRAKRFGKRSAAVRDWLAAQDAVFEACGKPGVSLPPLAADAPAWLRADRAYQEAALALYDGRLDEGARRFGAIARDSGSPWQPTGLYLQARTIQRAALTWPVAGRFAAAHLAIDRLAAAPAGTYGQGEVGHMRQVVEYHEHPGRLLARLDVELGRTAPVQDIAPAFRDYMTLSDKAAGRPAAADWIRTIQAKNRQEGLGHARERWTATGKVAWLIAALTLADPADAAAPDLVRAARAVAHDDPAWTTARYHAIRLSIDTADPATVRSEVDRILADAGLTRSDRNIFKAIRTQRAAGLADFVRFALRSPYCKPGSATCVDAIWPAGDGLVGRVDRNGFVGFGAEARAIIDRLPLAERVGLAADTSIPRELRLDLALTSYGRAVQLQDQGAITRLATMLETLLPQLGPDWRRIAATPAGPDRRFAEFFVMAKIPSIRVDLADHARPEGSVRQFAGYWVDWMLARPGATPPPMPFVPAGAYLPGSYWDESNGVDAAQEQADLTCLGKCGLGSFPLRPPSFLAALLPRARAERRFFLTNTATRQVSDATSLWEETLAYARSHPRDGRVPETLYRLIRVARWGGNHDHLGRRAFRLLHQRYPRSPWTARSPYYYD